MRNIKKYTEEIIIYFKGELLLESKNSSLLLSQLLFSLLIVLLFSFAFSFFPATFSLFFIATYWITTILSSSLFLQKTSLQENTDNYLIRILLTPISASSIFWGKFLFHSLFILFTQLWIFLLLKLLSPSFFLPNSFFLVAVLVTVGISALGTLITSITGKVSANSLLFPLLFFPLLIPLFFAALSLTSEMIEYSEVSFDWLKLLVAFDAIYLLLSSFLFPFILDSE